MLKEIVKQNNKTVDNIHKINETIKEYIDINGDVNTVEEIKNGYLFFSIVQLKSAQYKAPAFERFLEHKMNWEKISASLDKGDFIVKDDKDNKYVELKTSFTNQAMNLNIRQIRLWQDVDSYICIFIDDKNNMQQNYLFELTKKEMIKEVELIGGYTHGVAAINERNNNSEYSITIKIREGNSNFERWKNKYSNIELLNCILGGNK